MVSMTASSYSVKSEGWCMDKAVVYIKNAKKQDVNIKKKKKLDHLWHSLI
jgi:hypothetical protein